MAMKYHTKPTSHEAVLPAGRIRHQACNELQLSEQMPTIAKTV